ncbi:MAG: ABC transporter ATP-binding protein/permease [Bacilli bacterium]|nr:ABC transporter ATP-binding protein/permease [Bacilli bacterium]
MLQIKDLVKNYVQKDIETVHALRGVSIDFRKNEFVAILGPSGCGKTTFLNIIGGLDRYTRGDLLIKGKSTKEYKDKDWDTYRNHSVGFVFQSYNLIPHQTILQNVELALTISGISKKERKERATHALGKVGLSKMINKKPNQLSGGQMQRVAIARALVNDPEILLADEPTGALDSVTSIQVMDLLKEVAKDRLVIMVTHNPELAEKYASRIINMFDGEIKGDSNPYKIQPGEYDEEQEINKGKKYSQMKFFTAFGLSLSNLFSKAKRTSLVAVAGSIGIVGVSSVLAVSNGIKSYIVSMEDDMLSNYPIGIAEESVDYSSLMTGLQTQEVVEDVVFDKKTEIGLDSMIAYLMDKYKDFTSVKTNDINANLISFIEDAPEEAVAAKRYNYGIDVTNNIYTTFKKTASSSANMMSLNGITQMYISTLKTVDGFSDYAQFVDLFTSFLKQLPDNKEYVVGDGVNGQYKMLAGEYPSSANDILLVVDPNKQTMTDINLAQMGFYPQDEFLNIAKRAIAENDPENEDYGKTSEELDAIYPYDKSFKFEDLLGKELTYYPHNTIYSHSEIEASSSRSVSVSYVSFGAGGMDLAQMNYDFENDNFTGIGFKAGGSGVETIMMKRSEGSTLDIEHPAYGEFEGVRAGNPWKLRIVDAAGTTMIYDITTDPNPATPLAADQGENKLIKDEITPDVTAYNFPAVAKSTWNTGVNLRISGIAIAGDDTKFGCLSRGVYYTKEFADLFINDAKSSEIVNDPTYGIIAHIGSQKESASAFKAYVTYDYDSYKDDPNNATVTQGYASALNADFSASFASMFSGFSGGLNYFEVDKTYLRSLSGLSVKKIPATGTEYFHKVETIDGVDTDYTFEKLPQSISLYPTSFEMKDMLTDYLDKWNSSEDITVNGVTLTKDQRDDLTYTDTIETIIAVITTLIDIVSVALIIFTSLSLVVSCFMIAVITYISVMERVKEIGIIRSLGGRKKDVTRLFTAENLITGLSSGLIGVGFTYLLQIIANTILRILVYPPIVSFSILDALIMIALSILLSVLSGAIPSRNASKQDPVTALRSE